MAGTLRDLAGADLGGAVPEKVLRATGKSLLALGHRDGQPVVIKALRASEEFWAGKLAREIRVYQAFTQVPPPTRVPGLMHTDGHSVLVLERVPGHVADPELLELPGTRVITLPRAEDMERHRQAVTETLASLAPDIAEASSWEAETLHYARLPSAARSHVVVRGDLSAATMRAGA